MSPAPTGAVVEVRLEWQGASGVVPLFIYLLSTSSITQRDVERRKET